MPSWDFSRILEKEAPLFSGIASDDDHSRLLVTDFSSMWRAYLRTKKQRKAESGDKEKRLVPGVLMELVI